MNGIFHNCSHGTNTPSGISITQMYSEIFKYICHIVSLVKPKKLLYMAVDGVAPRAKQNQQRQRRFVAAKDAKIALVSLLFLFSFDFFYQYCMMKSAINVVDGTFCAFLFFV